MKVTKRFALATVGLGLAGALIGASVAQADPSGGGNAFDRPLQGEGSDTTEEVMNGLSEVLYDHDNDPATAPIKAIASWNAKSATGFTTRSASNTPVGSNCTYTGNPTPNSSYVEGARANGSGNGVRALRDAFQAANVTFGCLDFARSSSFPSASNLGTVKAKALDLATDSLSFAVTEPSSVPRALTKAQLVGAYKCTFGGFATGALKAIIPQAGSGTRQSWLEKVYAPDTAAQSETKLAAGDYPCVTDQTTLSGLGGANPIQEHNLAALSSTSIAPISTAQWMTQAYGTSPDTRAGTLLGTIKGTGGVVSYAVGLNPTYGDMALAAEDMILTRTVYNVVPTRTLTGGSAANPIAINIFEDTNSDPAINTSLLCQQNSIIRKFGLAPIATCGTGNIVNPAGS